mgnify:CR=1 FL=1
MIIAYWSFYCNNHMQGLNIYKLSVEMGNFIVNTYKYFYIAGFIFFVISIKFLIGDIKNLKMKLTEKVQKIKLYKLNENQNKKDEKSVVSKIPQETFVTCAKCGYRNKEASKFCQKCGEKIEAVLGEVK